jgi:hypothetical protein
VVSIGDAKGTMVIPIIFLSLTGIRENYCATQDRHDLGKSRELK